VTITGAEVPGRMLTIDALAGNDTVDASGLAAGAIARTIDADGDDVLVRGPGNAGLARAGSGSVAVPGTNGRSSGFNGPVLGGIAGRELIVYAVPPGCRQ
jgi:hypothetical protein